MKKVGKILVVTLLAALLLCVTAEALAETANKFSFDSKTKTISGTSEITYNFTLANTAKTLTVTCTRKRLDSDINVDEGTVSFKPMWDKNAEMKTLKTDTSTSWSFSSVASGTKKVRINSYGTTENTQYRVQASGTYKVTINKTELALLKGGTFTLATEYAGGLTKTWSSSNTKVATVSSAGKVTAKAGGTAKITCIAGDQSVSCTVYVYAMSPTKVEVGTTATTQLKTLGTTAKDTVTWSSSNSAIAKVTTKGKVTGVKAGTATISAKITSHVDSVVRTVKCTVTVKAPWTMQVTGGKLALRKTASKSGTLIKYVNDGTKVTVYSISNGWAKVKVGTQQGYMMASYLKKYTAPTATATATALPKPTPTTSKTVNGGNLALRKKPGGSLIGYIMDGKKLLMADIGDGWCYVKVRKNYMADASLRGDGYYYGYVMKQYLK